MRLSSTGAQVAKDARSLTEIWLFCSRSWRSAAKARRRSPLLGNIARKLAPISFIAMDALPPPSIRIAPRQGMRSLPSAAASSTKGRGILGTNRHIDRRIFVVADLHPLAALGDGIGVEQLAADGRPKQMFRPRLSHHPPDSGASHGRQSGSAATATRPSRGRSLRG